MESSDANKIRVDDVHLECYYPEFKEKNVSYEFYRKFTFNDSSYTTGNFVLINGEHDYEVAKIICIFTNEKKLMQLVVRKYIFARNIRKEFLNDRSIHFDEDNEVIEDLTKDYIIQADRIIKNCLLVLAHENEGSDVMKENNLDPSVYFFYRYTIKPDGLIPTLSTPSMKLSDNMKSSIRKSCSAMKQKCKVGSENTSIYLSDVTDKIISPNNPCKNINISATDSSFYSPHQRNSVKRNLNESFGPCPGGTNNSILNYSIMSDDDSENPLLLKLRVSDSNKKLYVPIKKLDEVRSSRQKNEMEFEITPIRKSTRKIERKSYAEYTSPVKNMPKKRAKSITGSENEESLEDSNNGRNSKNKGREFINKSLDVGCRMMSSSQEINVLNKRIRKIPKRYQNEVDESPEKKLTSQGFRRSLRLMIPSEDNKDISPKNIGNNSLEHNITNNTDLALCRVQETPRKKANLDESIRRSVLKVRLRSADIEDVSSNIKSRTPKNRLIDEEYSSDSEDNDTYQDGPRTSRLKKSSVVENDDRNFSLSKTPNTKNNMTPKSTSKQTPKGFMKQTPKLTKNRAKLIRDGVITPSMQSRSRVIAGDCTPLMKARSQLHVSYVPSALPCREKEYCDIYNFLEGKLLDGCGGCMYISGVPGTGKTATVTSVISNLQQNNTIPKFSYVSINGMRLTEPRQSYVEILKQLTGKTVPWEQAQRILEEKFTKLKKMAPTVMLIDELDILCTKRQDVVYNLLDWPTKAKNQLIVVTIANTMDLPERLLMSRVTSRLGLTRLTFQAYTHKQLREIVTKRLSGTECFNPDAIQFVARKVASVSGDARRALDICRRAAEIVESENVSQLVNMCHVNEALNAMITQPKVRAIKNCSRLEQLILQSIVAEVERTGVEETTFADVFKMLISCAAIEGFKMVSSTIAFSAVSHLSACRLILSDSKCNDITQKLILNVSIDDVYYALKKNQA